MKTFKIEFATIDDSRDILYFIKQLAKYEKMEKEVSATLLDIKESIFINKEAEVLILKEGNLKVGFALFFHNYSTFKGKKGLYLEDLFILPEHRGKGYGKKAFLSLAQIAKDRDCKRMEWSCLDWNEPSLEFYRVMGAKQLNGWLTLRLDENSINDVIKNQ
ncbi:GNAT family N-acetyltransferase [Candidatus Izimaplasma bacterium ZiA1]|uniref:GNAT family N-acetyltransferase n=1 Tax=Candidatus Izimoplasma sp. ZiA1 TaxID=2024899 RepID=UPI000BAA777E|nr:GNAT family N-acetyltransferase [Candidatus Izimaplasma bacterium ZiA1]